MGQLPTPEVLAKLASQATQMLFSVPVAYAGDCPPGLPEAADGHTVIVPLIGDPLYILTATASHTGGAALAGVMFECSADEASEEMIEDSLRELTNILAGQVKSLMAQEHQIGLPSRLDDAGTLAGANGWAGARLQVGSGTAEVDIAVAQYAGIDA
jgi:hypothetical protein